jgi:hypothetical protein
LTGSVPGIDREALTREAPASPEDLYSLYLAKLRQIRIAMHREDSEALRVIELEFGSLSPDEQHVLSMAVHDVTANRPRLGKVHFVRKLAAERFGARARRCPPALPSLPDGAALKL